MRPAAVLPPVVAGLFALFALAGCKPAAQSQAADAQCAARLATFDTLDFAVYSNQKWDRLAESHAPDIVVTWPDGHETTGLAQHVEDLKKDFVYAPDINIAVHPIRICSGDYTAVTGIETGTFTRPMPVAGGKVIPPTGKSFRMPMVTVAHWRGSTMDHEWLYWDGQAFMQQIGLAH